MKDLHYWDDLEKRMVELKAKKNKTNGEMLEIKSMRSKICSRNKTDKIRQNNTVKIKDKDYWIGLENRLEELKTKKMKTSEEMMEIGRIHARFSYRKKSKVVEINCKECKSIFFSEEKLADHESRLHATHECQFCNKSFPSLVKVRKHERVHTGEKPHLCLHCGKQFHLLESLIIHRKIHDPSNAITCKFCIKTFYSLGILNAHIRRNHTGEKTCVHCAKQFKCQENLTSHMKIHDLSNLLICEFCTKPFSSLSKLDMHVKCIHCKFEVECQHCMKKFAPF